MTRPHAPSPHASPRPFSRHLLAALAVCLLTPAPSRSETIMDQIGPGASYIVNQPAYSSQIFQSSSSAYNSVVVDNFTIIGASRMLTEVNVVLTGYGGFSSFANVTGYHVAIFSNVSAVVNSGTGLVGNLYNFDVAAGQASITTPYNASASALVQISINKVLAQGSYLIGVSAYLDQTVGGQIAVSTSSYQGFPNDSSSFLVNPGGGFGLGGNVAALNANAAYRIIGLAVVPEPASLAMLALGLGIAGIAARRSKRIA